jgi:hypothetical protein
MKWFFAVMAVFFAISGAGIPMVMCCIFSIAITLDDRITFVRQEMLREIAKAGKV